MLLKTSEGEMPQGYTTLHGKKYVETPVGMRFLLSGAVFKGLQCKEILPLERTMTF